MVQNPEVVGGKEGCHPTFLKSFIKPQRAVRTQWKRGIAALNGNSFLA